MPKVVSDEIDRLPAAVRMKPGTATQTTTHLVRKDWRLVGYRKRELELTLVLDSLEKHLGLEKILILREQMRETA
jgi:hypothetical protein